MSSTRIERFSDSCWPPGVGQWGDGGCHVAMWEDPQSADDLAEVLAGLPNHRPRYIRRLGLLCPCVRIPWIPGASHRPFWPESSWKGASRKRHGNSGTRDPACIPPVRGGTPVSATVRPLASPQSDFRVVLRDIPQTGNGARRDLPLCQPRVVNQLPLIPDNVRPRSGRCERRSPPGVSRLAVDKPAMDCRTPAAISQHPLRGIATGLLNRHGTSGCCSSGRCSR